MCQSFSHPITTNLLNKAHLYLEHSEGAFGSIVIMETRKKSKCLWNQEKESIMMETYKELYTMYKEVSFLYAAVHKYPNERANLLEKKG